MEYSDFNYPNDIVNQNVSFITQSDVLNYLHSYADHFDLHKYIKFNHVVVRVRPIGKSKWEILVKDLVNNNYIVEKFDAIFVCNGHYSTPNVSQIEGADIFKGKQIHSHDYRTAETFRGMLFKFNFCVAIVIKISKLNLKIFLPKHRKKMTMFL